LGALGYDSMQLELRLEELTNGYEQLFIDATPTNDIPEPTTMILLGSGLLGLFGLKRKKA